MKKFLLGLSIGIITPFLAIKGIEMYDDYQLNKAMKDSNRKLAELDSEEEIEEEECCSAS